MKKFTLFLSALLISMVSMAAPLGEGYSKVTDITTLAAGDKVVLYCDDAELGVTGYNGNKDATVAATGWVEYIVETAEGGVFLKDEAKGQYVLPASKAFKYASEPSIACNVSSDGILYGVISEQNYYLYDNNGQYYRMYVDKSSDSKYKPFYVYEVTSEGGTTPDDGGETPDDGGETPDDGGETPEPTPDPENPEGVLTCAEAVVICQETGETATTETYTIRGYVTNIASAYNAGYNNTSFWMADTKDGGKVFEAFRSTPLAEADKAVKVGDYVEVTGKLVNYKGNTPETEQGGTYTILEAAEGGEDPVEPEQPETPEEKPLTDGYTKVTNISALATGDKVVLYCDAYAVGVAGFDGNKSGIMAETGWVEYVVETVEGGILLKDEAAGKYAALLAKNSFHYADQGSVFNVTENALLATFLESENNTFFLYRNTNSQYGNPLCRMYTDKTGQAEYAPFYVYEVAGSNPTAVDNVTVNQNITKFFENGQLIIIKNGVKFNAQGQVVK